MQSQGQAEEQSEGGTAAISDGRWDLFFTVDFLHKPD
jgi:hypothetical protein